MADELTIESVADLDPETLDEAQTSFIQDHASELPEDQQERFKGVIEAKENQPIDPEKVEIPVRNVQPPPVKEKKEGKDGDEEEDEVDPDDEKTIGKVVKKQLEPVTTALKEVERLRDEAEVNSFLGSKPEYSRYKGVILKYMSHQAYKNIPVHNIAAMVSADDMQKIGAKKEREAAAAAKATQDKGNQVRKVSGKVDWQSVDKSTYEQQRNAVLNRQGA